MPTANFFPSNLQWFGMKKEVTYGTAQATPDTWIPIDVGSMKYNPDLHTLPDNAARGLMATTYQQVAGMETSTYAYKTFAYLDTAYQHWLATLGYTDTLTGAGDPYTHKTALNNAVTPAAQPPSYTLFWADAAGKVWQSAGAVIDTLKLTVKVDGLVEIEPQWRGMIATAIAPPSNTPSGTKPMPAWNSVISINGSPVADGSEVSVEYKRNAAAVETINNSQSPLAVGSFNLEVTGTGIFVYQGSTDARLVNYLNNTQQAFAVKIAPAGDAVHSLTLTHTVAAFTAATPQGSNKWMEIVANFTALANATDALDGKQSPAQAVLLTSVSTAY
jgi:hypothetical protein